MAVYTEMLMYLLSDSKCVLFIARKLSLVFYFSSLDGQQVVGSETPKRNTLDHIDEIFEKLIL